MATYRLTQPAFINGKYYEADVRNPQVVEFADDVEPSTTWEPVDAAAKTNLETLDKQKLETAEAARQAALNPKPVLAPLPKLPKRELVHTEGPDSGATSDTHQRPAPPTVPGTKEQRPQDLGTKEEQSHPSKHAVKRASDKDTL